MSAVLEFCAEGEEGQEREPAVPEGIQMQIHWDLSDGERYAHDAARWVRDHKAAFRALMSYMHGQVDAGNPCTTREDALSYAREKGMEVSVIADIKRDHNLYAGLTRYMVMLRPRLARTIRFRKSKMDPVDMVAIWHEVVDSRTFFFARDRMEAQRMVEIGSAEAM